MPSRRAVRVVAVAVLLAGSAVVAAGLLAAGTPGPPADEPTPTATRGAAGSTPTGTVERTPGSDVGLEERINRSNVSTAPIPPGAELTVVATQGFFVSDEDADLVAFTRAGEVVYHEARYGVYFDVDPVPGTRYTVEFAASEQIYGPDDECSDFDTNWCTDTVVERVNLSTGERERVWADRTPRVHSTRHHDVDRLNGTHLLVADIHEDSVYVVDTRDGEVGWRWDADDHYSRDQGGPEGDWTHVNDVEVLPDGRVMVSVRNMDEVLFLDPGEGVDESWTLGTDEDHSVLYEQHNPDYVPAERGGPAVVVGDSENNRVVEYRRTEGEWEQTWRWQDVRMQWPRDADRLPDGTTLVVDSHGDRVLEVTPDGEVVWTVHVGMPYDAERLGTGDESAGGPAIRPPGGDGNESGGVAGPSGGPSTAPPHVRPVLFVKNLLPGPWVNSLLYVAPRGIQFTELLVVAGLVVDVLAWGTLEYRWSGYSLRRGAARLRARLADAFG